MALPFCLILSMVWIHLGYQNALFTVRSLEIFLDFLRCQGAPFVASFFGMIKLKLNRDLLYVGITCEVQRSWDKRG